MKKSDSLEIQRVGVLFVLFVVVAAACLWAGWYWHRTTIGNCTSLSLSQGSSSGAAGTIYKNAVITNTGSATCSITGYPAVFMQADGVQLGSGAVPNSLYSVTTVTLAAGAKAHTVVAFPEQANFPAGSCSAIGTTMKVYVPGVVTALTAPWSDYSCPGFSATAIQAGAQ